MKSFADLYTRVDETTKTSVKVRALVDYFGSIGARDAAWAVYFLIGSKPKQVVPTAKLRTWAAAEAGIPDWLFEESYHAVGDLAETIALLLPDPVSESDEPLHVWVEQRLLPLREADLAEQHATIRAAWSSLGDRQRFVWNKLITGNFRLGVSKQLVTRALAEVAGIEPATVAHRLMGDWLPTAESFAALIAKESNDADTSRPYPYFLAHPLEAELTTLGSPEDWQAEWKWDGIRAQLIQRRGSTYLWSRGEELVTERYPELAQIGPSLPDGTVIDGEILPWKAGAVLPFHLLQRRIGRKALSKKLLAEVPVVLMAYDLLERDHEDMRSRPLEERRAALEEIVARSGREGRLLISPIVTGLNWDELATQRSLSRDRGVEGLMLKRKGSPYRVGRQRGDWWKWKVSPHTIDAVLIGAQPGSGKRASLYTDYTFGLWSDGELVTVAKAYSGLTDEEIRRVDAFVRRNTLARYGPVRMVKPDLVFELGFEGIQESSRHKSGVAVRFPRVLRWRDDKPPSEADTVESLRALITQPPARDDQGRLDFGED